jgi:UDP:flavonoid glycosyltransferase YjiC (YdhE family)
VETTVMRILVTSMPGMGHVHPLVPLVLGLQRAGHDGAWATAPAGLARIEMYGFRAIPSGAAPGVPSTRAGLMPWPDLRVLPPRERRAKGFGRRFGDVAVRMREDLAPIVDAFRPDVIVHDLAELAAAPIAAARGIPHVTVAFSGAVSDELVQGIVDAVVDLWSAEGLAVPSDAGLYEHLYLHRFPPALGPSPDSPNVRWVRPVGFDGGRVEEAPPWLATLGSERPAVYVTLGTVVSGPAQWREILAALDSLDVDAIATTGTQVDPSEIGPAPANVRVERYVPQSFILDRVSALVSHAGAGSMLAGASRGLPQLCLPMGADMWENADALAGSGACLTLEEDQRDAAAIRGALERLLEDEAFSTAARRVAMEIAALPHPDEYVPAIEALVIR